MAESLAEACRELRKRLGKVQEDFAREQGWRLNSVSRYERGRPPAAPALRRYLELAQQHGYHDLADVFVNRILQAEGIGVLSKEMLAKLPPPDEFERISNRVVSILMRPESDAMRTSLLSLVEREEARLIHEYATPQKRRPRGKR